MTHLAGSCHCGTVQFTLDAANPVGTAQRCNCSLCARRGAVAVIAPRAALAYTAGQANLTEYRFGTGVAAHYFCKTCGIYTHHNRRVNPAEVGVNIACLAGFDPFLPDVPVHDGRNHPSDTGRGGLYGRLHFSKEATA